MCKWVCQSDHLDRPAGRTSWTDQLDRPAGRTSWTDQLDRPAGRTSSFYLKPWPVRIFEDFPFSLYIVAASESDEGLVILNYDLSLKFPVSAFNQRPPPPIHNVSHVSILAQNPTHPNIIFEHFLIDMQREVINRGALKTGPLKTFRGKFRTNQRHFSLTLILLVSLLLYLSYSS